MLIDWKGYVFMYRAGAAALAIWAVVYRGVERELRKRRERGGEERRWEGGPWASPGRRSPHNKQRRKEGDEREEGGRGMA